jgi:hypothetical protein
MPWSYTVTTGANKRKDGTYGKRYKCLRRRWVSFIRGPNKKALEKQAIYSRRFGFLDLYSGNEQDGLICPSGYNIRQCFGVMQKLWFGYHKARQRENLEQMTKYAIAIQGVQEDMGIKTTSFPHLGLYGDQFILHNKKDERVVFEDHSALKAQQDEYDKWAAERAENAKKIQQELQRPEEAKQEELETFADDVGPGMLGGPDEEEEKVPLEEVLEPDEEEGEEIITITDDIPFLSGNRNQSQNQKRRATS